MLSCGPARERAAQATAKVGFVPTARPLAPGIPRRLAAGRHRRRRYACGLRDSGLVAYAGLAGLPPQVGVYGYVLGGLGYALLGSSRQLAIGLVGHPMFHNTLVVGSRVSDQDSWSDTNHVP